LALARYTIYRGKRPDGDPLPDGVRQDTRKHTRHVLRPPEKLVFRYLAAPGEAAWRAFERDYLAILEQRFAAEREAFDRLAAQAGAEDVFVGCNCPTKKNPDVNRCHTVIALRFMQRHYPALRVVFPGIE